MNTTETNADDNITPKPLHFLPAPAGGNFHSAVRRVLSERIAQVGAQGADWGRSSGDAPGGETCGASDAHLVDAANAALTNLVDRQVSCLAEYPTGEAGNGYLCDRTASELYELGLLIRLLDSVEDRAPLVSTAIQVVTFYRRLCDPDPSILRQLGDGIVDDLLAFHSPAAAPSSFRRVGTSIMACFVDQNRAEGHRVSWSKARVRLQKARKLWPKVIGVPGAKKDEMFEFHDRNPHLEPVFEEAIRHLPQGSRNDALRNADLPTDEPTGVLYDRLELLPVWNASNWVVADLDVFEARRHSPVLDLLLKLGSYLNTGFDPDRLFSAANLDPLGFVPQEHYQPAIRSRYSVQRRRIYG